MFVFRSGASLKVTYSPLQKRLPFCRNIYVKKVMKPLAFIFEQPSYTLLSVTDFFAVNDVIHVRTLRHINDDVA